MGKKNTTTKVPAPQHLCNLKITPIIQPLNKIMFTLNVVFYFFVILVYVIYINMSI